MSEDFNLTEINLQLFTLLQKVPANTKAAMLFSLLVSGDTINEAADNLSLLLILFAGLGLKVDGNELTFNNVKKQLELFNGFTLDLLKEPKIKVFIEGVLQQAQTHEKTH